MSETIPVELKRRTPEARDAYLSAKLAELMAELAAVRQQRDKLLEAAKWAYGYNTHVASGIGQSAMAFPSTQSKLLAAIEFAEPNPK